MEPTKPPRPTIDRLATSRQEFEARLSATRQALDREIGWVPQGKTWVMPLAAFACGLAVAAWLVARRRGD